MSTPQEVISSLRSAGFTLVPDGEKILVRGKATMTPEQRTALTQHKAAVLHHLRTDQMLLSVAGVESDAAILAALRMFDAKVKAVRPPGGQWVVRNDGGAA